MKIILKHFIPDKEYSYKDLDKVTVKTPGLWTWPSARLLWMQANGFDEENIQLHDPGLPPMENLIASHDLFTKAWVYPNDKAKNIMAFKKKT